MHATTIPTPLHHKSLTPLKKQKPSRYHPRCPNDPFRVRTISQKNYDMQRIPIKHGQKWQRALGECDRNPRSCRIVRCLWDRKGAYDAAMHVGMSLLLRELHTPWLAKQIPFPSSPKRTLPARTRMWHLQTAVCVGYLGGGCSKQTPRAKVM